MASFRDHISNHKVGLSRLGFILLITFTIFQLCLVIYFYSIPFRIRWRYDNIIAETPHLIHNPYSLSPTTDIWPDIVKQTQFPLSEPTPTLQPSTFDLDIDRTTLQMPDTLIDRQDAPFMLPSEPILFEGLLKPHNVAIQPLPPTPSGYKYFSIRRLTVTEPKYWYKTTGHTRIFHQALFTCFSDWFPYDLIKEQEDEHLTWAAQQPIYRDPDHLPETWDDLAQEEIEHNLRYPINTTRIDKDLLAQYYGYDKYDDMPYHPRIPTDKSKLPPFKSTYPFDSKKTPNWTHRCVTPWVHDQKLTVSHNPAYYNLFHNIDMTQVQRTIYPERSIKWSGSEDPRIYYDRCGRMKLNYGSYNDDTPIMPVWGTKTVDARFLDPKLQFVINEFCPSGEYIRPKLTHLIDGAYDGHTDSWEKNFLELQYGFGHSDMAQMVKMVNDYETYAITKDHKTNSLIFDQNAYNKLKQARTTGTNSNFYLNQLHSYLHHVFPMTVVNSTINLIEPSNNMQVKECLIQYSKDKSDELGMDLYMDSYHSATTLYLLKIDPLDYDFIKPTKMSKKPNTNKPQWVYFSIGHDRTLYNPEDKKSPHNRHWTMYRPILTMFDALTLELIAVRQIDFTAPGKCRESNDEAKEPMPAHCLTGGVGADCFHFCHLTYIHTLFPVETPLSYTILQDEQNNGNLNQQEMESIQENYYKLNPQAQGDGQFTPTNRSLHSVLPVYYTLDTQFFVSLNIDDKHTWLQELDLRAIWYHRYTCPSSLISSYDKWSRIDRSKTDLAELKFIWQQTPHYLFPYLPEWIGGRYARRLEFHDWDAFYTTLYFSINILVLSFIISIMYWFFIPKFIGLKNASQLLPSCCCSFTHPRYTSLTSRQGIGDSYDLDSDDI